MAPILPICIADFVISVSAENAPEQFFSGTFRPKNVQKADLELSSSNHF